MVKSKTTSLPVSLAKQLVTAFSCRLLIDPCRFHRKGVSRNAEYNGRAQNVVISCFARQKGSLLPENSVGLFPK